jgi:hypothetical protein
MDRRQQMMKWFPVVMRYGGFFGEMGSAIFWVLTNRLEPALLTSFGVMMGLGGGLEALRDLMGENDRDRDDDKRQTGPRKRAVR